MLTDYIREAMRLAHYELMENGRFFATVPPLEGLWTEGKTLEECREELHGALEDWLLLGLQLGHQIPVIAGIDLNKKAPVHAEAD